MSGNDQPTAASMALASTGRPSLFGIFYILAAFYASHHRVFDTVTACLKQAADMPVSEAAAKQAAIQETRAENKKTREEKTKEALEGIEAYFRRKKRSERSKEEVSADKEASKKRKKARADARAQSS